MQLAIRAATATLMLMSVVSPAMAQQDTARVRTDSLRADSARSLVTASPVALQAQMRAVPPMKPGRAFLSSFALPGLAQARFDRGSAGALFIAVELGALAMLKRSTDQVREARRFRDDSVVVDYIVGSDGTLRPAAIAGGGFTEDLVRRRRLHMEDWLALIAFNHLLSGADAFVAAQLWDLDAAVALYPTSGGGGVLVATFKW